MSTPRKWSREELESEARRFDWSAVDALTDEQIEEAARADPDVVLPTEADLEKFDLVIPAKSRRAKPEAAE